MYSQTQNFYSPVGSPVKQQQASAVSPLKQPRPQNANMYSGSDYKPLSKEQILGQPIEIIKGKLTSNP